MLYIFGSSVADSYCMVGCIDAAAGFWSGVSASREHIVRFQQLWQSHRPCARDVMHRLDAVGGSGSDRVNGELEAGTHHRGTRVTTSTGLGLPLCRSFALAGGGWVSLHDDDETTFSASPALVSSSLGLGYLHDGMDTGVASVSSTNGLVGLTQFWCIIPVVRVDATESGIAPVDDIRSLTRSLPSTVSGYEPTAPHTLPHHDEVSDTAPGVALKTLKATEAMHNRFD